MNKIYLQCKITEKSKIEVVRQITEDKLVARAKLINIAKEAIKEIRAMPDASIKERQERQSRWEELQAPFKEFGENIYTFEEEKEHFIIPVHKITDYEQVREFVL